MSAAEEAFAALDFEADEEWKDYLARVTIPADRPYDETVARMKRKWFKKNKDSALSIDPGAAEPASNQQSPPPPQQKTPAAPPKPEPTTLRGFFLRQESLYLLMNIWLCYNVVMYFVPLGDNGQAYHRACNVAFMKNFSKFVGKHGFSLSGIYRTAKGLFNKQYDAAKKAQSVMNDSYLHNSFIYLLFNSTPPIAFALFPIFLSALFSICEWQSQCVKLMLPSLSPRVDPILNRMIRHGKLDPETGHIKILYWNAWLSIAIAGVLLVQLFTPARSFLLFIVYVQFLIIRHTSNDRHQCIVIGEFKAKTDGVFHHDKCPSVVGKAYDMVLKGIAAIATRAAQ